MHRNVVDAIGMDLATLTRDRALLREGALSAGFALMQEQRRLWTQVTDRGHSVDPALEVLGVGIDRIRHRMGHFVGDAREVLAVSPVSKRESLEPCREANRRQVESGTRVRALFDIDGCDPEAAEILVEDADLPQYWCVASIQLKIVDRKLVVMDGPPVGGQRTAIAVTGHRALATAWQYWHAVRGTAVPVRSAAADNPVLAMTDRQREVAYLLADGRTDQEIAEHLDISLRTVRYDVSRLMRLLDARSRFGMGLTLGHLGFGHLTTRAVQRPAQPAGLAAVPAATGAR